MRADLAAIVRARGVERAALVRRFVDTKAEGAIEAVKRFRDPALLELFHALLRHPDWHVVHRALLTLEKMEDGSALADAFALLSHGEARLREKAAIACLSLWDRPGASPAKDASAAIAALRAREPDRHVRRALDALARRVAGTLVVDRLAAEVRVAGPDGLLWTPILDGMWEAGRVVPGFVPSYDSRGSDRTAADLPVAPRWEAPLLRGGERDARDEVPAGHRLQPFGFLRDGGRTFHTGEDVGAFLDGSGLYACADGVVKLVYAGSDMGTLLVVEHRLAPDRLVTVLAMHCGGVVFVHAGDRVEAGQLLGSMGLGFSIENGGHFAHFHLGVYPGPFVSGHNYGYAPVDWGLSDWYDPAVVLPEWIERTRPPVDDDGPASGPLAPAAALVRAGRYGEALPAVRALLETALDESTRAAAARLESALLDAGPSLIRRAQARRAAGFPSTARALLATHAARLAGLPRGEEPSKVAAAWDAEPAFVRDLEAEKAFDAAVESERVLLREQRMSDVIDLWEGLQDRLATTSLAMRVQSRLADRATSWRFRDARR